MTAKGTKKNSFATKAVRHGTTRSVFGEHSEAIFQTSSFIFDTAEEAAQRFSGDQDGPIYSRFSNPNTEMFEERLASLENAEASCATSTGMSAIMLTCLPFLKSGDRILATPSLFGATIQAFETVVKKFNIGVDYARLTDNTDWKAKLKSSTRLIFLESPSNPLNEIADLKKIAELSSKAGIISVVDNCICTPALQNPTAFGIDLSLHSATKYLNGHSDLAAGAIIGTEKNIKAISSTLNHLGGSLDPNTCYLLDRGIKTLSVRMERQCFNALKIAEFLNDHSEVESVNYPGLATNPNHDRAKRFLCGYGAMLSFILKGSEQRANDFINKLEIPVHTWSLGGVESLVVRPAQPPILILLIKNFLRLTFKSMGWSRSL